MKNDPMNEWVLKDEILASTHRWPVIVIFAMAGALVALLAAYLWPSPYRANVEISVELNPYRVLDDQYLAAFTNAEFRNIDDYKHWQMLQLSIIVLSDPYIAESLNRLREIDPYWDSVDQQELREMLSANWRNAGSWLLSANVDSESRAVDAVETWRDVIIDLTEDTIASSKSLFKLELNLRSLNDQLVENQLQEALLMELLQDLMEFRDKLSQLDLNSILPAEDHQALLAMSTQLSDFLPGDMPAVSSFPDQNSKASQYLDWVELMINPVENQIHSLQVVNEILIQEVSDISTLWEAGLQDGQGLSATLNLQNRKDSAAEVRQIRSYGLAALMGSMIGLLIWIGILVVQVTRKGYQ
jgi:hypothetical protein